MKVGQSQTIFSRNHYINIISIFFIWLSSSLCVLSSPDKSVFNALVFSATFAFAIMIIWAADSYLKTHLTKNQLLLIMLIFTAIMIELHLLNYIKFQPVAGFTLLWLALFYHAESAKILAVQIVIFITSFISFYLIFPYGIDFTLAALFIISILISERYLENKINWKFVLSAILFGTTLFYSILVSMVYLIYVFYVFRNNLYRIAAFTLLVLFIYTLLIFLTAGNYIRITEHIVSIPNDLFQTWQFGLLLILSIFVGWQAANLKEIFFSGGLIFIIAFILSSGLTSNEAKWHFTQAHFTILTIAIPFFIISIHEYRIDKFLGKI